MPMYDFRSDPIGRIALMKVLEKRATIGGIFSNLGKTLYYGGGALGRAIQAGFTGDPKAYENLRQNMKQLGTAGRGLAQNTAGTALRVLPWTAMALPLGIGTVASMALSPFANSLANKIESGQFSGRSISPALAFISPLGALAASMMSGRQGQAQMRPQQSQQMPNQTQMQGQPQQTPNPAQMQGQPQQMANPSQIQAQQLAINSPLNTQQPYLRMS